MGAGGAANAPGSADAIPPEQDVKLLLQKHTFDVAQLKAALGDEMKADCLYDDLWCLRYRVSLLNWLHAA